MRSLTPVSGESNSLRVIMFIMIIIIISSSSSSICVCICISISIIIIIIIIIIVVFHGGLCLAILQRKQLSPLIRGSESPSVYGSGTFGAARKYQSPGVMNHGLATLKYQLVA